MPARVGRKEVWQLHHRADGKVDVLPISAEGTLVKAAMLTTTGDRQGSFQYALGKTNLLRSIAAYRPKRILVSVTGYTRERVKGKRGTKDTWREKHTRVKMILKVEGVLTAKRREKLKSYLLQSVVTALRARGLRSQYKLEVVDWPRYMKKASDRRVQEGRIYAVSRSLSASLKELRRCRISVRLER